MPVPNDHDIVHYIILLSCDLGVKETLGPKHFVRASSPTEEPRQLMAKWRKKAYETFRFRPGSYSHTYGSVDLMADLITLVRRAVHDGNEDTLVRVLEYVLWAAAQQGAPGLASAVDLAFFLPGFRDHELCSLLRARLPEGLFAEKWRILMEEPPLPGEAAGA